MQALTYHGPGKRAGAYDTLGNAANERAFKLILQSAGPREVS